MLRFYVRCASLFLPLFVLLAVVVSVMGSGQPTPTVMRGFTEGCAGVTQPCWDGIIVSVTTREQARQSLEAHGFRWLNTTQYAGITRDWFEGDCNVTLFTRADEVVSALQLSFCGRLYIGDVLAVTGTPTDVVPIDSANALLRFGDAMVVYVVDWLSPMQPVLSITLGTDFVVGSRTRWRGFAANWVYCLQGVYRSDCFRT